MTIPVADSEEIDLFVRGFEIKKYREMVCETYIKEDYDLANAVINHWDFKRIKNKYIEKTRMYTENSYSKRMMRQEEKQFIYKIHLFQTYINLMENQKNIEVKLEALLNEPDYDIETEELYRQIFDKWERLLLSDV